jgi:uncharacterized protein YkwD
MKTVNVLLRGQSNALLFADRGGLARLESDLEAQTGASIRTFATWGQPGDLNTINSATAFTTWDTGGQEAGLLRYLDGLTAAVKADPTAVVWMHNEYDGQIAGLTKETWISEVKADMASVRAELGAETPYVFVPIAYNYGDSAKIAGWMAELAADPANNAVVMDVARGSDVTMSGDGWAGSSHMSDADAKLIGAKLADAMEGLVEDLAAGAPETAEGTAGQPVSDAPVVWPTGDDWGSIGFRVQWAADHDMGWNDPGPAFDPNKYLAEKNGTPTAPTPSPEAPAPTPEAPAEGGGGGGTTIGFQRAWTETFDGGLGGVGHKWGNITVRDGHVEVVSTADSGWSQAGFMQGPFGPEKNQGFGRYTVDLQFSTDAPGSYACIWPGSDKWPGPELDFVEVNGDGVAYSAVHWKGADGSDQYQTFTLNGVDVTQRHTYSLEWMDTHLAMSVDGVEMWRLADGGANEHMVPEDYAHGGENGAFGVGQLTGWAAQYQDSPVNTLTVYEMSYDRPVEVAGPAPQPTVPAPTQPAPEQPTQPTTPAPTQPAPEPSGYEYPAANDWGSIGPLVEQFYAANGWWESFEGIKASGWNPVDGWPEQETPVPTEPTTPTPEPEVPAPVPTQPVPEPEIPASGALTEEQAEALLLDLLNETRAENGKAPLLRDAELDDAAERHGRDMNEGPFSHTGSDGSTMAVRIKEAGYDYRSAGENIAYRTGELTVEQVTELHEQWVNSPGHFKNMVSDGYENVGLDLTVGTMNGRAAIFGTQDFGRPTDAERADGTGHEAEAPAPEVPAEPAPEQPAPEQPQEPQQPAPEPPEPEPEAPAPAEPEQPQEPAPEPPTEPTSPVETPDVCEDYGLVLGEMLEQMHDLFVRFEGMAQEAHAAFDQAFDIDHAAGDHHVFG